jgi:hypothetical protein
MAPHCRNPQSIIRIIRINTVKWVDGQIAGLVLVGLDNPMGAIGSFPGPVQGPDTCSQFLHFTLLGYFPGRILGSPALWEER